MEVGIFEIRQWKNYKTSNWDMPEINHKAGRNYGIEQLESNERDLMKVKNIACILLWHYRKQDTPEAYTLEQLEKQIRLALGEVE